MIREDLEGVKSMKDRTIVEQDRVETAVTDLFARILSRELLLLN